MGFSAAKRRYQAAFDAYNEIMKRNAQRVLAGEKPSEYDLEREMMALNECLRLGLSYLPLLRLNPTEPVTAPPSATVPYRA